MCVPMCSCFTTRGKIRALRTENTGGCFWSAAPDRVIHLLACVGPDSSEVLRATARVCRTPSDEPGPTLPTFTHCP